MVQVKHKIRINYGSNKPAYSHTHHTCSPWYGFFSNLIHLNFYFMEKAKEIVDVLNDLVMINNDRITGYQRAVKELKPGDADLKSLFDQIDR